MQTDVNDSIALKDLITVASPLIKTLVDTYVTPKLNSFNEKRKLNKEIYFVPTDVHFKEYYHRTYKKLSVINTLVFNNSQRFLKDIYLPLTLVAKNEEKLKYKVDSYPEFLSDEYQNILITDTAGMGKSTLMKKIFIDSIDKNLGIPIIIELRRLNKDKKLIDEILEQLNSLNKEFNSKFLLELLNEGGFIIILDGYDEISLNDRDIVTNDIQSFISKASENRYFITSRPEKALSSFGNFQEFYIEPLNKKDAFELLRKYDNQGSISALLIKKLQEKDMNNIEEFLTNPLLVSLLFTAFEHKQAIPFKKYLFYRQVYDANFESHDLTKGDSYTHNKYSKLEIDDFHRVLRHLGYNCLKIQKIEFNKDEILKLISESKIFCAGLNFKESDFLQDIIRTVPIFAQDGNYYRWAHKSLQEYFAAQFIYLDSKDKQNIILRKLVGNNSIEKFINVFDLYYDMDYKTFRNVIEYDLLKEYENFKQTKYISNFANITESSILKRRELCFLMEAFVFKVDNLDEKNPIDGNKLTEMLKICEKKFGMDQNKFNGVILNSNTENTFCIHYQNNKNSILSLLARKRNSIVKEIDFERNAKKEIIKINFPFKNEYELMRIDDDSNIIYNSKDNFDKVNKLLLITRLSRVTIDEKESLKRLKVIQQSIEIENQNDFLLNGI